MFEVDQKLIAECRDRADQLALQHQGYPPTADRVLQTLLRAVADRLVALNAMLPPPTVEPAEVR